MTPIRLDEKFALFSEHWRPKTIARLNGQEVTLIKVLGCFPGTGMRLRMSCSWFGAACFAWSFGTGW